MHALLWTLIVLFVLCLISHVLRVSWSDARLAAELAKEKTVQEARATASFGVIVNGILIAWIVAAIRGF